MGSLVQVGETLILPVVDFVEKAEWKNIKTWCEFIVDVERRELHDRAF